MTALVRFLAGPLIPLVLLSLSSASAEEQRISPEEAAQMIAEQRQIGVQQAGYVKELSAAMTREQRDEKWAKRKEAELEKSFAAAKDLPRGALKSVECRSSMCELRLQSSGQQTPQAVIEQLHAIDQWVAWSQPCGYTMATEAPTGEGAGEVRIFVSCREQAKGSQSATLQ